MRKKCTKWQNVWRTCASKGPPGMRNDTTVGPGTALATPEAPTLIWMGSPVVGEVEVTAAVTMLLGDWNAVASPRTDRGARGRLRWL